MPMTHPGESCAELDISTLAPIGLAFWANERLASMLVPNWRDVGRGWK